MFLHCHLGDRKGLWWVKTVPRASNMGHPAHLGVTLKKVRSDRPDTNLTASFLGQCFDTVGWAAGRASGL